MSLNWINRKAIFLTLLVILIGTSIYLICAFLLVDYSLNEDGTSNNDSNRAPLFEELPNRILSEDSQLLDTIDLNYFCFDPDSDALSYSFKVLCRAPRLNHASEDSGLISAAFLKRLSAFSILCCWK